MGGSRRGREVHTDFATIGSAPPPRPSAVLRRITRRQGSLPLLPLRWKRTGSFDAADSDVAAHQEPSQHGRERETAWVPSSTAAVAYRVPEAALLGLLLPAGGANDIQVFGHLIDRRRRSPASIAAAHT